VTTEAEFIQNGGDPLFLGSRCRGPLQPSSNLTKLNAVGREAYAQSGLDMRWYGRTWEFLNLFWFQVEGTRGWGSRRHTWGNLDCTHSGGPYSAHGSKLDYTGMSCMHKYFLMAMVDDHFDNIRDA
jgi:hypothetical protein